MKNLTSLIIALLFTLSGAAQTPGAFNYQAVIRNASGSILANQDVAITISVLEGENSTPVYTEDWNVQTNTFGLINLEIGSKDPETFKAIRWMNGPYNLSLMVNGEFLGTSPLLSVPFAHLAQRVVEGGADDADADPFNEIELPAQSGNSGKFLSSDGAKPFWTGISFIHLTDVPANLDTDASDDFSGYYYDLKNKPKTISSAQANAIEAHTALINVLRLKATADSTYLKTLIEQEVNNRIADVNTEEAARIEADAALAAKTKSDSTYFQGAIDAEAASRITADNALQTKAKADSTLLKNLIDQEIANRTADVNTEEAARIAADAALATKVQSDSTYFQNAIDAEAANRLTANNALLTKTKADSTLLKNLIDQEITDRTADVDTEEAARIAADAALTAKTQSDSTYFQNAIDAEAASRIAADNALQSKTKADSTLLKNLIEQEIADRTADVDTEEAARITADATLAAKTQSDSTYFQNAIDTEAASRIAADNTLQTKAKADSALLKNLIEQEVADRIADVDTEEAERIAADATLAAKNQSDSTYFQDAIDAEAASRIVADNALQSKTKADSTLLKNLIEQEIADRTADVDTEEAARVAADAALTAKTQSDSTYFQDAIDAETASRISADNTLQTKAKADSTLLKNLIYQEITDRTADVDTEEAARVAADAVMAAKAKNDSTYFQNAIDAEAASRIAANNALLTKAKADSTFLRNRIDQEITDRIADVDTEEAARIAADAALQAKNQSDSTYFQDAIDAERASRIATDNTLQTKAKSDSTLLKNLIEQEIADRIADVDTEETARITATLSNLQAIKDTAAQIRAAIPDVSGFLSSEADPVFSNSQAANIDATDINNLANLSGVNTGDQDISGIAINTQAVKDTASQIRAAIPDVSGFLSSETDPVFSNSQAANIDATDISNLANLSGVNTGDQNISGIAINTQAIKDTATQIRSAIPDVSGFQLASEDGDISATNEIELPATAEVGDLLQFNGTNWVAATPSAGGYQSKIVVKNLSTEPVETMLTIGNLDFKCEYESTTSTYLIMVRNSPGLFGISTAGYSALKTSKSSSTALVRNSFAGVNDSWRSITDIGITDYYQSLTIELYDSLTSVGSRGEFRMWRINASRSGWDTVMLRVEYFATPTE